MDKDREGERDVHVLQLSDVHFGQERGGLYGRDPEETLDAVLADVARRGLVPDVVVVTGDLVHDGSAEGYERLGAVLADIGPPVYCLGGNHDLSSPLEAVLPRPGVHVERSFRIGPWVMLFLDSNANGRSLDGDGVASDLPNRHVAAFEGAVEPADLAWLDRQLRATPAEHALVWLHHPPLTHPAYQKPTRSPLFETLFAVFDRHDKVRGVGAGHLHCGFSVRERGVDILACPSTWLVMDFDSGTEGPPAYRWHVLRADGRIDSEVHEVTDERWSQRPALPAWGFALIAGDTDLSDMLDLPQDEIIERLHESS